LRPGRISISHYENFPVASLLLPRHLRRPVQAIYAFARSADDIADEGDAAPETRLRNLDAYRTELERIDRGEPPSAPMFADLAGVIRAHALPLQPFRDLLDAFTQDVTKHRYADFGEVVAYCRKSANPVGQLLLALYRESDPRSLAHADALCSSLQLINFLQDVAVDYRKGRIYLPADEMEKFHVDESQIANGDASGIWWAFMRTQIERARKMLQAGAPLGRRLGGRIGLEVRMIVMGGEVILRKLHEAHGDVFHHRPVLRPGDWVYMFWRAVRAR
jgi:squalene synthase HpnC